MTNNRIPTTLFRRLGILFIVLIAVLIIANFAGNFFYFLNGVEEQQVGVKFRNRQIVEIVGPGIYSDVGIFVELKTISVQAIDFTVQDDEIITKDKQRIGLIVTGDIFRPSIAESEIIRNLWSQYQRVFLEDEAARTRIVNFARQAMKVCVGDRSFDDNIIGTSRDELRNCIDTELNESAATIGLHVENLVVPEVILSGAVQEALDAIVQSRLETEKAAQDQLKAQAEAGAEQARQEGEIRVEQSRIQEQTRQQITLAQLEQERLQAQLVIIEAERANSLATLETERVVIESTKANELLAAQESVEINRVLAEAAITAAEAETALQNQLALIYAANPEYLQLLLVQANANALNPTDKLIFTPEGTVPTLVIPGPGIVPTVDTAATVPVETAPAPEAEESP